MELKMLVAAIAYVLCIGVARADDADPKYKFSCLHYCQKHNYGHPIKYCCRAAQVVLGTAHSTSTTHATAAYATTTPAAAAHNTYATLTTTATLTTKTLNTVVPVVATPLLANLRTLSLGPAASANVPGTLHTTITTHQDSDVPRDLGECPPARDYCPRTSLEPHLTLCHTDYDCALTDKCCYDACIASHVCKTALVVHRHRRSSHHRRYGSRDPGAAAATEVVVREDGEPVHVLLDQNGNPVAASEGDFLTITRVFPPGAVPSRVPTSSATIPVSGHNLVYVVEDENGEVVEDASGNTLTLVRYTDGPTLLIHDEGMNVVTGKRAPAEGVFSGRVKKTLIPDLTIRSGRRYSRETSKQGSYQSGRFGGNVLTSQGKTVTLHGEERLTVVNSDGVTFAFGLPATADGTFPEGQYASIAVVDTDRLNTDALVDGEGNLIVDESGHLVTVKDIMDTVTQTNFYNPLVVVDGRGDTVTLLNVERNVVRLVDQFGHQVSVSPGGYDFILEDYSTEATVHHTERGLSIVVDGNGDVLEDMYGYPLLILPFHERHRRSILDYFLSDEKDARSGSGEEDTEDSTSALGEGSGEHDTETSGDYDATDVPPESERPVSDRSEDLEAMEEEEDAMMMMQGRASNKDEDQELDGLGVLSFMRRHLLAVEEGDTTEEPVVTDETEDDVATDETEDDMEGSEESQHRRRRRHEHKRKRSMDDNSMNPDRMDVQEGGEMDGDGGSGDGTDPQEANETDGSGGSDDNADPQEGKTDGNGDATDPQGDEEMDGSGEDDYPGMKETTDAPGSTGYRRRRFAMPMLPLLMMKRAAPPELQEGDDTTEAPEDCKDGMDCEDMEGSTPFPVYRRKRRELNWASEHNLYLFDYKSEPEEEDVYMTTTEGSLADHMEGDDEAKEEVTTEPAMTKGRRSVQQEHSSRDDSENLVPRRAFHLPEMMRDFAFHTINMADDMARLNEALLKPSTIAGKMISYLSMSVINPTNFMFILSYSAERTINTVIEVLQRTDIGFQEDPDGRVLDVVLTSVIKVVLDLLEEAMDIASQVRRLTSPHGRSLYL